MEDKKILIEKAYSKFIEEVTKINNDVIEEKFDGINFISYTIIVKL
jgi:hypothetical protein